ncbi:hypothetical protein HD806DRAFT_425938 [Xylariaceae sp. AK1471]|nr:hypothetical protein HD806DRAFT_425938 [Xylariaceae sp. AK1471]
MSPTYTMSAHLCKEIYKSFQNRQSSPESSVKSQAPPSSTRAFPHRSPSPETRSSVDSDRNDSSSVSSAPMSRSSSSSSWSWSGR